MVIPLQEYRIGHVSDLQWETMPLKPTPCQISHSLWLMLRALICSVLVELSRHGKIEGGTAVSVGVEVTPGLFLDNVPLVLLSYSRLILSSADDCSSFAPLIDIFVDVGCCDMPEDGKFSRSGQMHREKFDGFSCPGLSLRCPTLCRFSA